MSAWLIWVIAAGVLAVAEAGSMSLVLVMMAGGAAAGAVTAALGGPVFLQFVVAVVATLALLGGVRPVARRHRAIGGGGEFGSEALVGRSAEVLRTVDARDGRVRLNGAEWSARAYDESQTLEPGTSVRVMQISGATAVVLGEEEFLGRPGEDEARGDVR